MLGKVFAGIAVAGILTGAMATGAFADPATPSPSPARHRGEHKDVFRGAVVNVNDTELVVRGRGDETKSFEKTEKTKVFEGRHEPATWSEIKAGTDVAVAFEEHDGKLVARRVQIAAPRVRGRVESVTGSSITIRGKDGKDIRITVTDGTQFFAREGKHERKPGSLSEIKPGQYLMAVGGRGVNGSFDARIVVYGDKAAR